MKLRWIIFLVLVLMAVAMPPDRGIYVIQIEGKPAGFHFYSLKTDDNGFAHIGNTYMKINVMGAQTEARFITETTLTPDYYPLTYDLYMSSNDMEQSISASFAADTVGFSITSGPDSMNASVYLDANTLVLDNNVYDLFRVMLQKADWAGGKKREFNVYMPQTMRKGTASIIPGAEMEYRGEKARRVTLDLMGMEMNGIVSPDGRILHRLDSPMQSVVIQRMDELDTAAVKNSDYLPVSIMENIFYRPSQPILDPGSVTFVSIGGEVAVPQVGDGLYDGRTVFTGSKDGSVSGRWSIEKIDYSDVRSDKYPVKEPDRELSRWLTPTEEYPKGDSLIAALAAGIARDDDRVFDAAYDMYIFVRDRISFTPGYSAPRKTLDTKMGDPVSQAGLLATMLRSQGIPARVVGGLHFISGVFTLHYWVEAYVGKDGWIPFDPVSGYDEYFSPLHIPLFTGRGKTGPPPGNDVLDIDFDQLNQ